MDEWYIALSNDDRIVWEYMLDTCTIAGRLKKNFKMLNFCCNVEYDEEKLLKIFNGRVVDKGGFYFIPKYLKFQYPRGLGSLKPAIVSVRNELVEYDLLQMVVELFGNDYLIVKDKDKDKVKDKDKDKDIFNSARKIYLGRKRGNDTEFANFAKKHKDWREVLPILEPTIRKQIEARAASNGFVPEWKHFATWINQRCWEEEPAEITKSAIAKTKLFPIANKTCYVEGCSMPAVYKRVGEYDSYYCLDHSPAAVQEKYC